MNYQDLITIENNVPFTTSYKIADELGIQHRSLMQLIKDHQPTIERHFGKLRFENAPSGKTRQKQIFAILLENQANYVLMLSGNTIKSMEVKALFVKAFDEAKKIIEELLRERLYQTDDINEVHRRMRDYNMWLARAMYFTTTEKTTFLAFSGILKGLGFAANAFLDTSLGAAFYPWCESQGYDMSLVKKTKQKYLVGYRLREDGITYDWNQPNYYPVWSYPEDPFGLAWTKFLVEYYWPDRFLPYITYKYKGEERAKNVESGLKVISFFTGLTYKQITERSKKGKR